MEIFLNFSPTSSHLHPLQVENCDSDSRLVVDEDDHDQFRLTRVKAQCQYYVAGHSYSYDLFFLTGVILSG